MPYKDPIKQKEAQHRSYLKNKDKVYIRARRDLSKKKEYLRQVKNNPCVDCTIKYPYYVMDLDHREGEEKDRKVSSMLKSAGWKRFLDECKKCDLVCSNCHRIRTYKRKQHYNNGPIV